MDSDKYKQFKKLYTEFIHGTDRLSKQMANDVDIEQEKKEFISSVIEPMDALWLTLTDEEKNYWSKVDDAIRVLKRSGRLKA